MIIAGEASGDRHAAALVRALREAGENEFHFFGMTGREMRAEGVEEIVRADELSLTGLLEVGRALPVFWRVFRRLRDEAARRKPDAAILVDYPEFNLPLAKALRKRGVKVIYYISPQLWAWRAYRVRRMRRDVDLLLTILPFEKEWYAARSFHKVEFIGHPLAGEIHAPTREERETLRRDFAARHALDSSQPIIAFLPGSRRKELKLNLPPMLDAAAIILNENPSAQFVIPLASTRSLEEAKTHLDALAPNVREKLRVVHHATRETLAIADVAAVASGTATLEAALANAPLVIVYKETFINWHTLGRLIRVPHYGLPNLIAQSRIVPELMQNDFNGATLARELLKLLEPHANARARAALRRAVSQLGSGGATRRAAETILRFLKRNK